MTTSNIISTPDITGNIGSCAPVSDTIETDNSILTAQYQTTQVNSCTGNVIAQSNFTTYGGVWFLIVFGMILLSIIGMVNLDSSSYF